MKTTWAVAFIIGEYDIIITNRCFCLFVCLFVRTGERNTPLSEFSDLQGPNSSGHWASYISKSSKCCVDSPLAALYQV